MVYKGEIRDIYSVLWDEKSKFWCVCLKRWMDGCRKCGRITKLSCEFSQAQGFDDLKGAEQSFVDAHEGAGVVELAAIVWRRKDGDELPVSEELVAVFDHLVGPTNEIEIVFFQKLGDLVGAEGVGDAPVVLAPAADVGVGIGPEEVTQEALVGDVHGPLDGFDLVEALHVRRQPSVHAEDLVVDDRRHGQTVEAVGEYLPEADAESALALVVEAVDSVDRGTLVVSSEKEKVFWEFYLVGQQEAYGLHALFSSVHVVSQEEVVGIRRKPTVLEQSQQVWILSVYVP